MTIYYDSNNNEYTVVDNVLTIDKGVNGTGVMPDFTQSGGILTIINWNRPTSVIINNNITNIGDYAFYQCTTTTSIIIPNSVTSIGQHAFKNCESIVSIEIPNGITSINKYTFDRCKALTSITIPNSVTSIGEYAFDGCISLPSITIPNSVTSIANCVFFKCTSLSSVTLSENITTIPFYGFYQCKALSSVTIPNGVQSIGACAFKGCASLTSITIPSNVTSIAYHVFEDCTNLASIIMSGITPPSISTSPFPITTSLIVPLSAFPTYLTSWSSYASQIQTSSPITISVSNATASKNSSTYTIDNDGFSVIFTANEYYDLSAPTVTINGTTYAGYTWVDGILTIPSSAINGGISIIETAIPHIYKDSNNNEYYMDNDTLYVSKGTSGTGSMQNCTSSSNIGQTLNLGDFSKVVISNDITYIGNYAFYNEYNLEYFTVNRTTPPTLGTNVFTKNTVIFVPSNLLNSYKSAWSSYSSQIYGIGSDTYNSPNHDYFEMSECKKYSVWISTEPYNSNGNNFVSIGLGSVVGANCTYGGNTTGILGQPSSKAVYVDSSSGSTMNITINATRANDVRIINNKTIGYTNAQFEDILDGLIERTQFLTNAYVLRIFRTDWTNNELTYHDLYVFAENATTSIDLKSPETMNVTLSLIRRNRTRGFGSV